MSEYIYELYTKTAVGFSNLAVIYFSFVAPNYNLQVDIHYTWNATLFIISILQNTLRNINMVSLQIRPKNKDGVVKARHCTVYMLFLRFLGAFLFFFFFFLNTLLKLFFYAMYLICACRFLLQYIFKSQNERIEIRGMSSFVIFLII